ncbi:4638_t:CDS:2, partial [Gigaspora rosea]
QENLQQENLQQENLQQENLQQKNLQQENLYHSELTFSSIEWKEPNENREDIDILPFVTFLEEVKLDYQNAGKPLRAALDKFKERYNVAKSKSVSWLSSYLYELNHNMDPIARVKSGARIRVQVELVKRRKVENGSRK